MRPVNLIPPEDRRGDHAPLRAGVASYAILGVLALGLVAVVLVVLTNNGIDESKAKLAKLQAREAQAQTTSGELAPYANFASLSQARSETVSSLAESRFDWQRVLNELALVIPPQVTLMNLTGTASSGVTVGEASSTGSAGSESISGPSLLISGCAASQEGVAAFLAALKDIDGVTRVGMQSSELGEEGDAAAAPSTDDAQTDDCQTRPSIARFEITVAFDAVPVSAAAAAPDSSAISAAVPTTTTPAPTTTTPATATADTSGVAQTQDEQQSAVDSANEQVSEAKKGAAAVGVNGG